MKTSFIATLATLIAACHLAEHHLVAAIEDVGADSEVPSHIRERVLARRRERSASPVENVVHQHTNQKHRMALSLVKREFEVLDQSVNDEGRELIKKAADHSDLEHRMAVRYTLNFDECLGGITVEECEKIIDEILKEDPALFRGIDHIDYFVEMLQQPGDPNYNVVGIVTDMSGTHARGWNGDGIIRFYNPDYDRDSVWCTSDEPCPDNRNHLLWVEDKCCFAIGPWDCDTGVPKTVDECCDMIKSSVPLPDFEGNQIECYDSHPLGSPENPIEYNRVHILVDGDGLVVGEPVNE